eukprot:CAMPEP_0174742480 /NCGR_PEP_ID=MMETSP1094-20130205/79005_1 /TAXON_ID=156173 /ORGANISM="Chrysochromulina brevifilum, Strain UTEX LB 985" /LENGTH=40 /DNA_ID= /DNA_START= /DNA_END= /DNA_ORIENTATION=
MSIIGAAAAGWTMGDCGCAAGPGWSRSDVGSVAMAMVEGT